MTTINKAIENLNKCTDNRKEKNKGNAGVEDDSN